MERYNIFIKIIFKMLYKFEVIQYRFNNNNPIRILIKLDKLILRFIWKNKGPRITKTLLKNIAEEGDPTRLILKLQ